MSVSSNIEQANEFLVKAREATERGHYESATVWTAMAQACVTAYVGDKIGIVASKIDRLASVVNQGRSWS